MANFKYNDPLLNRQMRFAATGYPFEAGDMGPRIEGAYGYNMNVSGGQIPYAPTQPAVLGGESYVAPAPPPPYAYDQAIGTPGFQPIDFNMDGEVVGIGAPVTQAAPGSGVPPPITYGYEDGTTVQVDPLTGLQSSVRPGMTLRQINAQSEIGAPVTETPPELRVGTAAAAGTAAAGTAATGTAAAGAGTGSEADLIKAGAESRGMKAAGAATGVGQIVGGITNIFMGARALKDVDIAGAEGAVREAYATRPGLGTPSEFYQMQKEAYDQRLVAMRLEDINRGIATNVAAAQQYGARGLGSTLAATAQAQRAQQQEVLQQQRFQTTALGALASAREREIQRREDRATFDIGIAYDQLKAEQAREQYAKQQIAQGIVGTAAGIARTAVTFGAEQGAKVTPGEFSHDTNPIDIVQEGTKIGEMTGGEYIFNPQQAGKMAREAKKGNSPLHKFVRKTLNKFHKDAEKYEGK